MQEQFSYNKSAHIAGLSSFSAIMKDFSYGKHAHEEYSIGVTCRGRQDFFSNGAFHKSNAGNIIFFNPEQVHDGHAGAGEEMAYQMLYIPEPTLMNLILALGSAKKKCARLDMSLFQDSMLQSQIFSLTSAMNSSTSLSSLEEEHLLLGIAHSIIRIGDGTLTDNHSYGRIDSLLNRAKEFIHDNLHRKCSVDEIANAANMSKYHFIRLFNEQFGMTPHQYVLGHKINRAKYELELGKNAADIAFQYGFSDLSHLNRNFKNAFGITPNQYQKQLSL
ncbi:AraC family transcriptional regulator [Vibrio coralliilyticus]|uniref:AraC family transcriptional regulator n=1 Tax=Vibrio coralliilyticus TaxID=190893 RepID=A0A837G8Y1_9VIBR|nr:AraC family transcriptional regulator [Vibrio coralliilyticus]KJY73054.1 AraC family transcriptional regulator [Vibrio coralliilyticus]QOU31731.1 AraC family transcriptional regulator [Vibrio coralliilyticus]